MKKSYEKPKVYMERFELAEHIAQCGITVSFNPNGECSVEMTSPDGEYTYQAFLGGPCAVYPEDICYTSGASISSTLNS